MEKKEYFKTLIGKYVRLSKDVNLGYQYRYQGTIISVDETSLIIKDNKLGNILLSFDSLSVLQVGNSTFHQMRQW